MEGMPISVATYSKGCRCEDCKALGSARRAENYRRAKAGLTRLRPPGVVWVDDSGITQVVRCERCDKNYGTWVLDPEEAKAFADAHRHGHIEDAPFDWSAYDEARLMKNPGGRPPLDERPLCENEVCTEPAHAKGL